MNLLFLLKIGLQDAHKPASTHEQMSHWNSQKVQIGSLIVHLSIFGKKVLRNVILQIANSFKKLDISFQLYALFLKCIDQEPSC